jgi:hypothetical protein
MIQRLYIDNELVDLADGTKITLNFKSNIFGDISKITASNSQTIQLPKTIRNCRIFDNPTAVAYNSEFRYTRHACRYEQNGVELLNGYAVMLSSTTTYEIALYWGIMSALQAWVDANPSLRELEGNEYDEWNSASAILTYSTMLNRGYGFANYMMEGKQSGRIVSIASSVRNDHPSVLVRWILNKIEAQHGITFTFPTRIADDVRHLAMPCLTANAGERYWADAKLTATASLSPGTAAGHYETAMLRAVDVVAPEYITVTDRQESAFEGVRTYFVTAGASKVRFTFKDFTSGRYNANSVFVVSAKTTDNRDNVGVEYNATANASNVFGFDISEEMDVEGMDEVCFFIRNIANTSGAWSAEAFTYTPLVAENHYPCKFDIMPNLPDISQIDFIKALCAMLGVFAMPDTENPNNILFVGIEDLMNNRASAYDWSQGLIGLPGGDSQDVQFSISEWAQKNWCRYTEDEDVNINADAPLVVQNEALEREREAVQLPFAPTDGNKILQYELSFDVGTGITTTTLLDVKPRIMRLMEDENGKAVLHFNGLKFEDLLAKYYTAYSTLLNSAVVTKEKMRLSEYDIRDVDFTKPIYLSQYGRYFGLVSLQVSGEECTAELAKLPTSQTMSMNV